MGRRQVAGDQKGHAKPREKLVQRKGMRETISGNRGGRGMKATNLKGCRCLISELLRWVRPIIEAVNQTLKNLFTLLYAHLGGGVGRGREMPAFTTLQRSWKME